MRLARALTLAAAAAVGLLSMGCEFQPLYGARSDAPGVAAELAAVSIPEQKTRIGQLVRNRLLSAMSPVGTEGVTRYRLDLTPDKNQDDMLVDIRGDVGRRAYRVHVDFALVERGSNKVLLSGRTFSQVSYDRVNSEFANIQAEANASERAANEVSEDIRTRLAAFLASR